MEKTEMMNQSDFERLSQLMADKGVRHEAFELLADLRMSERNFAEKAQAYDRLMSMNSISENDIQIVLDGNAWCAYRLPFRNLQEDDAGFGDTPQMALTALLESELPDGWEAM
jgi:hypothetical protein